MGTLRDKAIQAYREKQAREGARRGVTVEPSFGVLFQTINRFILHILPAARAEDVRVEKDATWGAVGTIRGEDVRFTADAELNVYLLGQCPHCGRECRSQPFSNLEGLGERLQNFRPENAHSCSRT